MIIAKFIKTNSLKKNSLNFCATAQVNPVTVSSEDIANVISNSGTILTNKDNIYDKADQIKSMAIGNISIAALGIIFTLIIFITQNMETKSNDTHKYVSMRKILILLSALMFSIMLVINIFQVISANDTKDDTNNIENSALFIKTKSSDFNEVIQAAKSATDSNLINMKMALNASDNLKLNNTDDQNSMIAAILNLDDQYTTTKTTLDTLTSTTDQQNLARLNALTYLLNQIATLAQNTNGTKVTNSIFSNMSLNTVFNASQIDALIAQDNFLTSTQEQLGRMSDYYDKLSALMINYNSIINPNVNLSIENSEDIKSMQSNFSKYITQFKTIINQFNLINNTTNTIDTANISTLISSSVTDLIKYKDKLASIIDSYNTQKGTTYSVDTDNIDTSISNLLSQFSIGIQDIINTYNSANLSSTQLDLNSTDIIGKLNKIILEFAKTLNAYNAIAATEDVNSVLTFDDNSSIALNQKFAALNNLKEYYNSTLGQSNSSLFTKFTNFSTISINNALQKLKSITDTYNSVANSDKNIITIETNLISNYLSTLKIIWSAYNSKSNSQIGNLQDLSTALNSLLNNVSIISNQFNSALGSTVVSDKIDALNMNDLSNSIVKLKDIVQKYNNLTGNTAFNINTFTTDKISNLFNAFSSIISNYNNSITDSANQINAIDLNKVVISINSLTSSLSTIISSYNNLAITPINLDNISQVSSSVANVINNLGLICFQFHSNIDNSKKIDSTSWVTNLNITLSKFKDIVNVYNEKFEPAKTKNIQTFTLDDMNTLITCISSMIDNYNNLSSPNNKLSFNNLSHVATAINTVSQNLKLIYSKFNNGTNQQYIDTINTTDLALKLNDIISIWTQYYGASSVTDLSTIWSQYYGENSVGTISPVLQNSAIERQNTALAALLSKYNTLTGSTITNSAFTINLITDLVDEYQKLLTAYNDNAKTAITYTSFNQKVPTLFSDLSTLIGTYNINNSRTSTLTTANKSKLDAETLSQITTFLQKFNLVMDAIKIVNSTMNIDSLDQTFLVNAVNVFSAAVSTYVAELTASNRANFAADLTITNFISDLNTIISAMGSISRKYNLKSGDVDTFGESENPITAVTSTKINNIIDYMYEIFTAYKTNITDNVPAADTTSINAVTVSAVKTKVTEMFTMLKNIATSYNTKYDIKNTKTTPVISTRIDSITETILTNQISIVYNILSAYKTNLSDNNLATTGITLSSIEGKVTDIFNKMIAIATKYNARNNINNTNSTPSTLTSMESITSTKITNVLESAYNIINKYITKEIAIGNTDFTDATTSTIKFNNLIDTTAYEGLSQIITQESKILSNLDNLYNIIIKYNALSPNTKLTSSNIAGTSGTPAVAFNIISNILTDFKSIWDQYTTSYTSITSKFDQRATTDIDTIKTDIAD